MIDCACNACTGSAAGEELILIGVIILVVFILVGLFVSVFIGSVYVQRVMLKHVHILHKRSQCDIMQVVDLDVDHTSSGLEICEEYI